MKGPQFELEQSWKTCWSWDEGLQLVKNGLDRALNDAIHYPSSVSGEHVPSSWMEETVEKFKKWRHPWEGWAEGGAWGGAAAAENIELANKDFYLPREVNAIWFWDRNGMGERWCHGLSSEGARGEVTVAKAERTRTKEENLCRVSNGKLGEGSESKILS